MWEAWKAQYTGRLILRSVYRGRNGGTAAALNSAIEAAPEAEWIWPLAADDLMMEDALAEWRRVQALGADAMPAGYWAFGHASNGVPIDEAASTSTRLYHVENIREGFRRGQHLSSGCSPFKRKYWERVGFDEDLRTAEDTLFWLRIAALGARFIPSRRPVVRVRYHAGRKSFTPVARDRATKIRMIRERMDRPVCDFLASERHFIDHLVPVWLALAPWARGRFLVPRSLRAYASEKGARAIGYTEDDIHGTLQAEETLTVTASAGDQLLAGSSGRWTVYGEHGTGQTYNRPHSSYANWPHRRNVALFLAPGKHPAAMFRQCFPAVPVAEVGCPMLDVWQTGERAQPTGKTVAISFHWNLTVVPETTSAWQHYQGVLKDLARRFDVIGHAHPRIADKMKGVYQRAGIEFVPLFDEVLARASVYCVDNSSTLFAFAAAAPPGQSRPVVVLNCPAYRKNVHHGMRFWDYADIGPQVDDPADLSGAIEWARSGAHHSRREEILDAVYSVRDGTAARRAARAIEEALEAPRPARGTRRRAIRTSRPTLSYNGNGHMPEPKNVRMIARVTFSNKQHEGTVIKDSAFFTTERRAKDLEHPRHNLAYRAPVGPATTKTAGPTLEKPALPSASKTTRADLMKALDAAGIAYSPKARKADLLELLTEAA